jgi:hypothetical protein
MKRELLFNIRVDKIEKFKQKVSSIAVHLRLFLIKFNFKELSKDEGNYLTFFSEMALVFPIELFSQVSFFQKPIVKSEIFLRSSYI